MLDVLHRTLISQLPLLRRRTLITSRLQELNRLLDRRSLLRLETAETDTLRILLSGPPRELEVSCKIGVLLIPLIVVELGRDMTIIRLHEIAVERTRMGIPAVLEDRVGEDLVNIMLVLMPSHLDGRNLGSRRIHSFLPMSDDRFLRLSALRSPTSVIHQFLTAVDTATDQTETCNASKNSAEDDTRTGTVVRITGLFYYDRRRTTLTELAPGDGLGESSTMSGFMSNRLLNLLSSSYSPQKDQF